MFYIYFVFLSLSLSLSPPPPLSFPPLFKEVVLQVSMISEGINIHTMGERINRLSLGLASTMD